MSRFDEVAALRVDIAKAAAARWQERHAVRQDMLRRLDEAGPAGAEDPDLVARFDRRAQGPRLERALAPPPLPRDFRAERIIGADDRRKLPADGAQLEAGRPVARIVDFGGLGGAPRGFGTGFMVSPRLLMTNHHVLGEASHAIGIGANFGHDHQPGGGVLPGALFDLDPDTFFLSDQRLDFALVAVAERARDGAALGDRGHHTLIAETGKIVLGKRVNIIQHPMGGAKQYATEGAGLVDRLPDFLHYQTDTEPGSSGSPGFNDFWEVIALHHSGVPLMDGSVVLNTSGQPWDPSQGDKAVQWIANEGVRISRIMAHLSSLDPERLTGGALLTEMLDGDGEDAEAPVVPGPAQTTSVTLAPGTTLSLPDSGLVVHIDGEGTVNTGPVTINNAPAPAGGERLPGPALLERKLTFDQNYARRRGFDIRFLPGFAVDMPSVSPARRAEMVRDRYGNPVVLDYHHYSLTMNAQWMLQMWSAVNVDYSPEVRWPFTRRDFGTDTWIHDPRLPESLQIDDPELYKPARKFDRGHIVRREDAAWGSTREEVFFANSDTFHWTNCTPQHEDFNRHAFGRRGVWGGLENHIAAQAGAVGDRAVVFAGPVLDPARSVRHDFGGGRFDVPLEFWKVVVVAQARPRGRALGLAAFGFVMEQRTVIDTHGLERLSTEEAFSVEGYEAQQRPLAAIEARTGVSFARNVLAADVLGGEAATVSVALDGLEAVRL